MPSAETPSRKKSSQRSQSRSLRPRRSQRLRRSLLRCPQPLPRLHLSLRQLLLQTQLQSPPLSQQCPLSLVTTKLLRRHITRQPSQYLTRLVRSPTVSVRICKLTLTPMGMSLLRSMTTMAPRKSITELQKPNTRLLSLRRVSTRKPLTK